MPTESMGKLTEHGPTKTLGAVRQAADIFLYARAFLPIKIGPISAGSKRHYGNKDVTNR